MKKTVVLLAVLSLSVACSKIKDAEKNMNNMNEKTTQMKENTTVMYQQVRSKEAEDTRNQKFEILNSKKEGFGAKLAAASVYFKSFEFQLWTGSEDFDTQHARNILILDAANEFTKRISDLHEKINVRKMSPANDGRRHSKEVAFYALAATMHMNHHYQEEMISHKTSIDAISFYDIIKNSLKKEYNLEPMTEAEEVLATTVNKEIMIDLIKARVDIISALALRNLTDKRNMTLTQKGKALLFKLTKGKYGAIELPETFSDANAATKKQVIKYLEAATNAKKFLSSIGVEKELEKTLKAAYSKIKLGDIEAEADENSIQEEEMKEEADTRKVKIKSLINGLLR